MSRNINLEWHSFKETVIKSVSEGVGNWKRRYKNTGLKFWNEDIFKNVFILKNNMEAYLKMLNI